MVVKAPGTPLGKGFRLPCVAHSIEPGSYRLLLQEPLLYLGRSSAPVTCLIWEEPGALWPWPCPALSPHWVLSGRSWMDPDMGQ